MENLKVTREVILDLLPLYESGEASADTKRLITEFLDQDKELAHLISRMKQATRLQPEGGMPAAAVELKSLERTKRLMNRQRSILAMAVLFSLLPFIFTFENSRITWLLIRDAPLVGGAYLLTGIVMWICYLAIRRKLKIV